MSSEWQDGKFDINCFQEETQSCRTLRFDYYDSSIQKFFCKTEIVHYACLPLTNAMDHWQCVQYEFQLLYIECIAVWMVSEKKLKPLPLFANPDELEHFIEDITSDNLNKLLTKHA